MFSFCSHRADLGNGKLAFSGRCVRCKHKAVLQPMSLAMRFGMAHQIERVYGQLVYSKRGARGEALDVGMVGR
jgi:hypothetical protein